MDPNTISDGGQNLHNVLLVYIQSIPMISKPFPKYNHYIWHIYISLYKVLVPDIIALLLQNQNLIGSDQAFQWAVILDLSWKYIYQWSDIVSHALNWQSVTIY